MDRLVPIDRGHFDYDPRIGDNVQIREIPKFKVRRDGIIPFPKSRSVMYTVLSLDPLLARPVSLTVVKTHYNGEIMSIKTRCFR